MIGVLTFVAVFALAMALRERALARNRLLERILPDIQASDPQAIWETQTGEAPLVVLLRPVGALLEAVLGPAVRRKGMDALHERYTRAGKPGGVTAEEWYLFVLVLAVGAAIAALLGVTPWRGPLYGAIAAGLAGVAVRPLSNLYLDERYRARARQVRSALLGWLEALVTAVEAGASLGRAIELTAGDVPGLLGVELAVAARKAQGDWGAVLGEMADRLDVPELSGAVSALRQQLTLGGPVAEVLRAQAHDLREARRAAAEEVAGKAVLKLLIPALLSLGSTLIVLLWPALSQFQHTFG